MKREPIGEIRCPLCQRQAELHEFAAREKLDPEGGEGKPAYPRKFFVVCPPVQGYRGCGTILANGAEAQERLLELGHVYGASRDKPARKVAQASGEAAAHAAQATVTARPAAPTPPTRNPFKLW